VWRYNSTSALDGGDWSGSHPSHFTSGRKPLVINVQEDGWAPVLFWTLWNREKSLAPNQTLVIQPIARHYTNSAFLALNIYETNYLMFKGQLIQYLKGY
jgi:hypothetical protein